MCLMVLATYPEYSYLGVCITVQLHALAALLVLFLLEIKEICHWPSNYTINYKEMPTKPLKSHSPLSSSSSTRNHWKEC